MEFMVAGHRLELLGRALVQSGAWFMSDASAYFRSKDSAQRIRLIFSGSGDHWYTLLSWTRGRPWKTIKKINILAVH